MRVFASALLCGLCLQRAHVGLLASVLEEVGRRPVHALRGGALVATWQVVASPLYRPPRWVNSGLRVQTIHGRVCNAGLQGGCPAFLCSPSPLDALQVSFAAVDGKAGCGAGGAGCRGTETNVSKRPLAPGVPISAPCGLVCVCKLPSCQQMGRAVESPWVCVCSLWLTHGTQGLHSARRTGVLHTCSLPVAAGKCQPATARPRGWPCASTATCIAPDCAVPAGYRTAPDYT